MKFTPALAALCTLFVAAFTTEPNVARPGGDYATVPAATAEACSAACSADSLCMSWSFSEAERQCDLKAVVPAPMRAEGISSGIAARAPAFARVALLPPAPQELPAPVQDETVLRPAPVRAATADDEADSNLLGGPEGDDLALRAHLRDDL